MSLCLFIFASDDDWCENVVIQTKIKTRKPEILPVLLPKKSAMEILNKIGPRIAPCGTADRDVKVLHTLSFASSFR